MKSNLQYSAKLFICTANTDDGREILYQTWDSYSFSYYAFLDKNKDNLPRSCKVKKVLAKTASEATKVFFEIVQQHFVTNASGKWEIIPLQNAIDSTLEGPYYIKEFEEPNKIYS